MMAGTVAAMVNPNAMMMPVVMMHRGDRRGRRRRGFADRRWRRRWIPAAAAAWALREACR